MSRIALVLVSLLVLLVASGPARSDPKVGTPAPEINGKELSTDQPMRLSDFKGKVVVLEFWADWCPHCKNMLPYDKTLIKRMQGKPFVLLGVNFDKKRGNA